MSESFNWHKAVTKKWDQNVAFWSEKSRSMWNEGSRSGIIPFVKRYVPVGSQMADIGCGDGYGAFLLSEAGYDVTGVDISPKMIEHANQISGDRLIFKQGDLAELPFEQHTYDGLMAINSLEWTEDPKHALDELYRVLKPGGRLCIAVLGPTAGPRQNSYRRLYGEDVICNTMMPWEFEQLASETGWRTLDGYGVFKEGVKEDVSHMPKPLQQALTFLWVFMLEKQ
ncbi:MULTISPECIES: class I SAM-dependent methyltransferase [Pontibacillus]|uniref:Class I SAM-dependent methyltransferase n=1 Tax=Pontibacillus chungwhensis TaxID=265426 RepID=A0ABY8UZL2_9BACI|nr:MULTISPECIES: class I SAM-dependent methyltransferase [Pontibacillus]MCD5323696.1 class I SAM-dependent methyltransferase [Pontibacillus sp. HN14]WIF97061.1 class I SAM-dependent methyltransferase [Pontibacillus chungwhensis]